MRSLAPDEIRQIYSVREMLQREAAQLIPLPAPTSLVRELEGLQAQFRYFVQEKNHRRAREMNDRSAQLCHARFKCWAAVVRRYFGVTPIRCIVTISPRWA